MFVRLLQRQLRPLLLAAVFVYIPLLILLIATIITSSVKQIGISHFLRDTTTISGYPFYTGVLSNIGILIWCSTAAICLFAYVILSKTDAFREHAVFLLNAWCVTVILMLDDAFLVHETVGPRYLNIPTIIILATYGILISLFFFFNRRVIYRSDYSLLLLGLAFLSASLLFDIAEDYAIVPLLHFDSHDLQVLLEDGCKLFGIAGWFSYFVWHSYVCLSKHAAGTAAP